MSDLAPSPAESDAAPSPIQTRRPPDSTQPAPQGNPPQRHLAETYPPSPAAGNRSAETAKRSRDAGHFARVWQRAGLQALAVIAAAMVGLAFGRVVAGNDYRMQLFFATTVGIGLFLVFSGLAKQLNRNRRKVWRH